MNVKYFPTCFGSKGISIYIWQNVCICYKDISMIASFKKKKIQKIDSYLTLYQNQESIVNKSHLALLRNITLWLFNS